MSRELRTYTFTIVIEPADEMWHAYCPMLLAYDAGRPAYQEPVTEKRIVVKICALLEEDAPHPA